MTPLLALFSLAFLCLGVGLAVGFAFGRQVGFEAGFRRGHRAAKAWPRSHVEILAEERLALQVKKPADFTKLIGS